MLDSSSRRWTRGMAMAMTLGLVGAAGLAGQDERPLGWTDQAELTFVLTAGNASASTFGVKNALQHNWENATFKLNAGGVRTFATVRTGNATGTVDNFTPVETEDVTAANYFVRSRYDRSLSEAAYLFGGAGWDRNTFAGIESRYSFVTGSGRTWHDEETRRFKTDLGVTYTIQDDVTPTPGADDAFFGLRGTWDLFRKLTETTDFGSELIVDENLNNTSDLRADFTNWISVAMSDRMALKSSLQLLFDNDPALEEFTLLATSTPVTRSLDKLDSILTVALVVNF